MFTVALIDLTSRTHDRSAPAASAQAATDRLQRRLTAASDAWSLQADRPAAALSDLLAAPAAAAERGIAGPAASRGGDPRDQASIGRRPSGQSQPCWRIPSRRLPIRMRILLDAEGGLAGPPRPVRPAQGAADVAAVRDALRAMAGCAPYVAAAPGRYRAIELDFSRAGDIVVPAGFVEVR